MALPMLESHVDLLAIIASDLTESLQEQQNRGVSFCLLRCLDWLVYLQQLLYKQLI